MDNETLDGLIAEKVMDHPRPQEPGKWIGIVKCGWTFCYCMNSPRLLSKWIPPAYSQNSDHLLPIMTALMNKGIVVMVKADGTRDRNKFSVQVVSLNSAYTLRRRYTDDVMYTLCLMSLAAMGIAVGGMEDNAFSQ